MDRQQKLAEVIEDLRGVVGEDALPLRSEGKLCLSVRGGKLFLTKVLVDDRIKKLPEREVQ